MDSVVIVSNKMDAMSEKNALGQSITQSTPGPTPTPQRMLEECMETMEQLERKSEQNFKNMDICMGHVLKAHERLLTVKLVGGPVNHRKARGVEFECKRVKLMYKRLISRGKELITGYQMITNTFSTLLDEGSRVGSE
jgi:hypothetical protein